MPRRSAFQLPRPTPEPPPDENVDENSYVRAEDLIAATAPSLPNQIVVSSPDVAAARRFLADVLDRDETALPEPELRSIYESGTHATGAVPSIAHMFTIRETAEIIGQSYHTTRNMALRGAFGELLRSEAEDMRAIIYVERHGLLTYLRAMMESHIDDAVTMRVAHDRLETLSGPDVRDVVESEATGRSRVETAVFDNDVTDEYANLAQAFENVSQAFTALLGTFDGMREEMRVEHVQSNRRDLDNAQQIGRVHHTVSEILRVQRRESANFSAHVNQIEIQYDEERSEFVLTDTTMSNHILRVGTSNVYLTENALAAIRRRRNETERMPVADVDQLYLRRESGRFEFFFYPNNDTTTVPMLVAVANRFTWASGAELAPHALALNPELPAPRPQTLTPPPLRELAESTVARAFDAATLIPDYHPDQIVTVTDGAVSTTHRTRHALSAGELVVVDESTELRAARRGDPTSWIVGTVTAIRDAGPDALEPIQAVMELTMPFSDRREILHPFRGITHRVETSYAGVPHWPDSAYFVLVQFDIHPEEQQTTLRWRPV